MKLINRIKTFWRRFWIEPPLFEPLTAADDLFVGEKLIVYGDHLFPHDPAGSLPAVFVATRNIKVGEKVTRDPTDPAADVKVLLWDFKDGKS